MTGKGASNKTVNDAFIYASTENTRWVQAVLRLLEVNGFYDAYLYPYNINKDTLKNQFIDRCKGNYLQELRHSDCTEITEKPANKKLYF